MWNCFSRDLAGYVRTRFPLRLAVLLPSFICAGAILPSRQSTTSLETVASFVLAVLLVFEFRLWDDLADRVRDQERYPNRVLCQATSIVAFQRFCGVLALINMCLVAGLRSWWSFAVLLLLHVLLAAWYGTRDRWRAGIVINYHAVLLKYAGFVLILGTTSHAKLTPRLFISSVVVYLSLCVFEVLHDPQLRTLRAAWLMLTFDAALLLVTISVSIW